MIVLQCFNLDRISRVELTLPADKCKRMCKQKFMIGYFVISLFLISKTQTKTASDQQKQEPNWEANVNVTSIDDVSANISWNLLKGIQRYYVLYKIINTKDKPKIVSVSSGSAVLNKLERGTEYTVTVMAGRPKGKFRSDPITFRTLESACPENIVVKSQDIDSVEITWDIKLKDVTKYDIIYKAADFHGTRVITTNLKSVTLTKLAVGIPYTLNIVAVKLTKRYMSRQIVFRTVDPVEYYGVSQFDDLEVDDVTHSENPSRPEGFDFNEASSELSEKLNTSRDKGVCIWISRSNIVNDTFTQLKIYRKNLKSIARVRFAGEDGNDSGGLTKEWFSIFSKEVFNPKIGLFVYSDEKLSEVEINPLSNKFYLDHLLYFELLGKFTGLALSHQQFLDVFFSIPFLKTLMRRPISLNDIKIVDPEFYRSLCWIRDHDPAELKLTFVAQESKKGNIIKLMKNGDKIKVQQKNKLKYIRLLINHKYIRRVQIQMAAFIMGFTSIIPLHYLDKFNENELQMLIGGSQMIDLEFWKDCTTYNDGYDSGSLQIEWFWKAVDAFDDEQRTRLLQFVTGTSRFSHIGDRKFTFEICKRGCAEKLPEASTCFNKLYLPPYKSYDQLFEKLRKVTEFDSEYALDDIRFFHYTR